MKNNLLLSFVTAFTFVFTACENKKDAPEATDYSGGIYIVNEGSFQSNNGSVSYYDPLSGVIINGLFESANGRPLGDVVQSLAIAGDTNGFIVVNGSGKLEIVDLRTFKSISDPVPVDYPRYFLPVNDDKGYLTGGSMQGYIYHVDLRTFQIVDSIPVGQGPETMVKLDQDVFVANSGGWGIDSTVYRIHAETDQIVDTIHTGKAPVDLTFDGSDNLWVYCKGQAVYSWDPPYDLISETDALIQQVSAINGNVLWQGVVGKAGDYTATPPRLAVSDDGEEIYYLRPDGVYKINTRDPAISASPLITGNFYGLDVNPEDGNIFVFQASFTGNGTMKIYTSEGVLLSEGTVGIAPNGASFH